MSFGITVQPLIKELDYIVELGFWVYLFGGAEKGGSFLSNNRKIEIKARSVEERTEGFGENLDKVDT